eukprot:COSAG01_NODE_3956_length_5496_cov_105.592737_4_plen_98_part_00
MSHMTCLLPAPAALRRRGAASDPHRDAPPPRPVPQQPGPRAAAASTCCSHAREEGQTGRRLGEEAESGKRTEGGQGGGPWGSHGPDEAAGAAALLGF